MNYIDGKLKIVELNLYAFKLKEEMNEKVSKIKEKNKDVRKQGQSIVSELKQFYLKGFGTKYRGKDFNLTYDLWMECYGADALGGCSDYMKRYREIVSDYKSKGENSDEDFVGYYYKMLVLYSEIVREFGTCNFDVFDNKFSSYVLKNVPIDNSEVNELVYRVVNHNHYGYERISNWFKSNAQDVINIYDKWSVVETEDNDEINEVISFYNEQIEEIKKLIGELENDVNKLKIS